MPKRTIIIAWWWSSGGLTDTFDEWKVTDSSDGLVRMDIPYRSGAFGTLQQILRQRAGQNVLLFLHRAHGYTQQSIEEITQLPEVSQLQKFDAFLFGEGSDYLYIANNPRGLLGSKGTFIANFPSGESISAIANETLQTIKKGHFDNVWSYYKNSYRQRVFECSEDLYIALTPLAIQQPIEKGTPYQLLRKPGNELLLLRLVSFVGKMRKGSKPESDLRRYEMLHKRTYNFANLAQYLSLNHPPQTLEAYHNLIDTIKAALLSNKEELRLSELRDEFTSFIEKMQ